MTVAGQATVNYSWDRASRLTAISQGAAAVGFLYDNANRRSQLTLPNGVAINYAYDTDSRLTGITYFANGSSLGNLTYGPYDRNSRLTGIGGSLAAANLPPPVNVGAVNADNELPSFGGSSLSYDLDGNLQNDGVNTYNWDSRNHLVGISGGTSASFVYDGFGRRMSKTVSGATTQFLYDGFNSLQELSGGGSPTVTANMLAGLNIDEFFVRSDNNGTQAYLSDGLGSTLGLVNSSGLLGTSYSYQPFGATSASGSASTNPNQFAGRENDGNGVYYFRARFYSAPLQRFLSQDPIGFDGGDTNTYAYALNDPVDFLDPTGLARFAYRLLNFGTGTSAHVASAAVLAGSVLLGGPPGAHEVVIFDKPQNLSDLNLPAETNVVGFTDTNGKLKGPGKIEADGPGNFDYVVEPGHYDDAAMVKALRAVYRKGLGTYCVIGNNCQDFANKLRLEYRQEVGCSANH